MSVERNGDRYDDDGEDQCDVVQGQVLGRVGVSASSDDRTHLLNSDSVRSDRIFSTFDKVRGGRYCKGEEEQTDISKGRLKKKNLARTFLTVVKSTQEILQSRIFYLCQ